MKKSKHIYTLELTERQAKLLSWACDQFPRLIQGQDMAYQELFEQAWEKRCKEAVGGHGMDKEWDGGWSAMRDEAEAWCKVIKKRFWGMAANAHHGIHYDDSADILWDIHRVLRHQFYVDRGDTSSTVDAENPTSSIGDEPLAVVRRMDVSTNDLATEVEYLYTEISKCVAAFVKAKAEKKEAAIARAQCLMEKLLVALQQDLSVIYNKLKNHEV